MKPPSKPPSPPPFRLASSTAGSMPSAGDKPVEHGHFTMSGLAALYTSTFAPGFSNNERQAAARAVLRHDAHIDGTHYQTRTLGGLHPSYIGFNWLKNDYDESERTLIHRELIDAAL